jgi:heat shock protein HslJ
MRILLLSVMMLAATLLIVGCQTPSPSPDLLPLTGTKWLLTELNGKPLAATAGLTTPTLTLDAAAKRASGVSGINRYSGGYELVDAKLKFGMFMGTRMAGPPAAMAVESEFLQAMSGVTEWKIEGRQLQLLGGGKVLLRFAPAP